MCRFAGSKAGSPLAFHQFGGGFVPSPIALAQVNLSESNDIGGDFDELVILDVFEGGFQEELSGWLKDDVFIVPKIGRAHV